jgi:hypothetical protein
MTTLHWQTITPEMRQVMAAFVQSFALFLHPKVIRPNFSCLTQKVGFRIEADVENKK